MIYLRSGMSLKHHYFVGCCRTLLRWRHSAAWVKKKKKTRKILVSKECMSPLYQFSENSCGSCFVVLLSFGRWRKWESFKVSSKISVSGGAFSFLHMLLRMPLCSRRSCRDLTVNLGVETERPVHWWPFDLWGECPPMSRNLNLE